jgi:hypothetical protein
MSLLKEIAELLRGNKADVKLLAQGTEHLHPLPFIIASVVLGVVYGLAMGLFSLLTREPVCGMQMLASAIKVPALFYLTLLVTFPSLYVFSALFGARLSLRDVLRVIVAALAINLVVLASFAPITAFFTLNTTSYHFMKLLNVFFFMIAGGIGLEFLMRVLRRLEQAQAWAQFTASQPKPAPDTPAQPAPTTPPLPPAAGSSRAIFRIWLLLYAVVGAQMGWVLRPFIGSPDLPFTWFRERQANIFIDVMRTIGHIFGA